MCPLASIRVITNGDFIEQLEGVNDIRIDLSLYEKASDERMKTLQDMFGDMLHVKDIFNDSIRGFNNRAGNAAFEADVNAVQHNCCNIPFYKAAVDVNGDVY
jgi:radical SAM protein with 4Fe4S-binding SPASM domain